MLSQYYIQILQLNDNKSFLIANLPAIPLAREVIVAESGEILLLCGYSVSYKRLLFLFFPLDNLFDINSNTTEHTIDVTIYKVRANDSIGSQIASLRIAGFILNFAFALDYKTVSKKKKKKKKRKKERNLLI